MAEGEDAEAGNCEGRTGRRGCGGLDWGWICGCLVKLGFTMDEDGTACCRDEEGRSEVFCSSCSTTADVVSPAFVELFSGTSPDSCGAFARVPGGGSVDSIGSTELCKSWKKGLR